MCIAHPLRDRLVRLQMLAMFRAGRQAEATRVFQAHRARLADEPAAELVDLDRRIGQRRRSRAGDAVAQQGTRPLDARGIENRLRSLARQNQ